MKPASPAEALAAASRLIDAGETGQAGSLLSQVLASEPGRPDALYLSGLLHERAGKPEMAMTCFRQALVQRDDLPVLHCGLGRALQAVGSPEQAAASFHRALTLDPASVEARSNLSGALIELGRLEEACVLARFALALQPDSPEAAGNLGTALSKLGRHDEATDCLRRALEMPAAPAISSQLRIALVQTLLRQDRFGDALDCLRQILASGTDNAEVSNEFGMALTFSGRYRDGIAWLERAVSQEPNSIAHYGLSIALLRMGDFRRGLVEYEWRWRAYGKAFGSMARIRGLTQPLWDGSPFPGRRLLVHAEQGFGDTIQFARYVSLVAGRGGTVILEVQPTLKRLLTGLPGVATLLARGEALPPFDLQCPIMSLPLAFGTTLQTIPARVPYLHPAAELRGEWKARVRRGGGLRVGIVWAGAPVPRHRTIPLEEMAPLFAVPGIDFYSFQAGSASGDLERLNLSAQVRDFSPLLTDFAETAAGLAEMDLLVTIDTAVAHLAGALGVDTWVLVPFIPDWRWFLDREDSPWYPTMRLFRLSEPDNWAEAIARVRAALQERAARHDAEASSGAA